MCRGQQIYFSQLEFFVNASVLLSTLRALGLIVPICVPVWRSPSSLGKCHPSRTVFRRRDGNAQCAHVLLLRFSGTACRVSRCLNIRTGTASGQDKQQSGKNEAMGAACPHEFL